MDPIEQTAGGDPWSEVPPEVQELLKAEMARRDNGSKVADTDETKPKKTTRRKSTKATTDADKAAADEAAEA